MPLCEPISDEEMEELEKERKKQMDELFPLPTGPDEGDDNEPPFQEVQGDATLEAAATGIGTEADPDSAADGIEAGDEA